jgi:hypothetical protein
VLSSKRETWARPMNTLPNILPETEAIRVGGITGLKGIADELNRREILTANGGRWYATRLMDSNFRFRMREAADLSFRFLSMSPKLSAF